MIVIYVPIEIIKNSKCIIVYNNDIINQSS